MVSCRFADDQLASGMGTLILGNMVLTCARLFRSATHSAVKSIVFISQIEGDQGQIHKVKDLHELCIPPDAADDVAVLKLEGESLIESQGRLALHEKMFGMYYRPVSLFSYFQPRQGVLKLCEQQKHFANLNHSAQQLGSPVLIQSQGTRAPKTIGVYTLGNRRVSFTARAEVQTWLQKTSSTKDYEMAFSYRRIE